jgi:ABC-2 type transport system permease protein
MNINRILASIQKEFLLLSRDRVGLLILFVMPLALVTIMALVQDAPFRDYQEIKVEVLLLDEDGQPLGAQVKKALDSTGMFRVTSSKISFTEAKEKVDAGEFQMSILIPDSTTECLQTGIQGYVSKTLESMGMERKPQPIQTSATGLISVYAKPGTKQGFLNALSGYLRQVIAQQESATLLSFFKKELGLKGGAEEMKGVISVNIASGETGKPHAKEMNSVQHNVPAWTMFGMFFIVISLAGSMVTERESGSYTRIKTMPGSYMEIVLSKLMAYLGVCMTQCLIMLLVGLFLLPLMGLDQLHIGSSYGVLAIVTIVSGLAATGYGVLVGTVFKTHQQASTFGSVSVVIMAALGGIWVPVYVMPEALQVLAGFSPLNWGLGAYQNVFLGDGNLSSVWQQVCKLFLFFVITMVFALFFDKKANKSQGL